MTTQPPATPFRKLIEWLDTTDAPVSPWPSLQHRPRVATATVHQVSGRFGSEDVVMKGAWAGTLEMRKGLWVWPWALVGVISAQPRLPTDAPNPNPDPLNVGILIGRDSSTKKFWGRVTNPSIDPKWEEDGMLVINADIDALAPVIVATLEDFADQDGDRFAITVGPGRSFFF